MIGDAFVFNAVAHAYNLTEENTLPNRYAVAVREALVFQPIAWEQGICAPEELRRTDWSVETLARTLFLESDVDMAATHTLRLDSYFRDGLAARAKTVEAVTRYPQRFVGYVGLDPTAGLQRCLADLDEQLDEMPTAIGLKLYPAQVDPLRSWRMDDPTLMYPLYQRALERGIKTVAIHKAVPLGPVPMGPYRLGDIDCAADAFPELNFEIVHAGMAFGEEAAMAMARFPNVFANLEVSAALVYVSPGQFEEMLARFIFWGALDKVLFSDGCMFMHSHPIVTALWDFQFSAATLAKWGIPQITPADKAAILGGNYARVIGLDIEAALKEIADDEFSQERAETGVQEPYSNWLAAAGSGR